MCALMCFYQHDGQLEGDSFGGGQRSGFAHGLSVHWGIYCEEAKEVWQAWYVAQLEIVQWQQVTRTFGCRCACMQTLMGPHQQENMNICRAPFLGHMPNATDTHITVWFGNVSLTMNPNQKSNVGGMVTFFSSSAHQKVNAKLSTEVGPASQEDG